MFGWLLMLAVIIVLWFMIPEAIGTKKKKLIFMGLSFAMVVFILGSRGDYAANCLDLSNYIKWYNYAIDLPLSELLEYDELESGYLILNNIVAWFVPWKFFFNYVQAAFCTGVMFWYIYRNVDDVFFGVIVYICLGPWQFFLTAFRQSFATCLCFIAFELIKKKKTSYDLLSLGIVALASTLHTTAWVFLAVFVVRCFKVGKGIVVFSIITALGMTQVIDELVKFGNEALGREYVTGSYFGNVFAGIIPIAIYMVTLILCYFAWHNDKGFIEKHALDINMLIFGLCLYTLRYNTHVFERISFYFTPVISVVLPAAVSKQKSKIESNMITIICIALCISLFIYRSVSQFGEYYFFWE